MYAQKHQLSLTIIMIVGKKQECSIDSGFRRCDKNRKMSTVNYLQKII